MTDDNGGSLSTGERLFTTAILGGLATLTLLDALVDLRIGGSTPHITVELLVAAGAVACTGWLWTRYFRLRLRLSQTGQSLAQAQAEATVWRERHRSLLDGLSGAIDQQLDAWQLTPAEKEVALLLLKGRSFKEIAPVRNASERTVRQQALSVYAKSGLAGRAELAAFFLEDLLAPAPPSTP